MRPVIALCCALMLAACGAEAPDSADRGREVLLARAGDALLAVDTETGRVRRRFADAHDHGWRTLYSVEEGDAGTRVVATDPVTGKRLRTTELPGPWKIPVAAGPTPEGAVSGDGRWLVLAGDDRGGVSRFALLPTAMDGPPQRFRLRGRFDFDALAPDGSAVYLSQIERSGRYRVRAFDVRRGRLRPQVVVEKTSIGTIMEGVPVARAVDPSGAPVHTLYRGGPAGAFIHSLDTARGTALCILIPRSRKAGPEWQLRLDERSSQLHALNPALGAHYVVDPYTGETAEAPAGVELPATRLGTYHLDDGGRLMVARKAIAELEPGAELLALREG